MASIAVRKAEKAQISEVAHTLGRAFFEDPVTTWIVPDAGRRAKALPVMFAAIARRQFLGDAGVQIAVDNAEIGAAALWSSPGHWRTGRLTELRMLPALIRAFGSDGARGKRVGELMKKHHPDEPHWYLAMIGSDPTFRGQGFAHALLTERLAQVDAEHAPAYLESSNPDNVPYYQRFGFEVTGELVVPDGGPTLWAMWRKPR